MFDNDDEDWLRERWLDLVTPLTSDHFGVHASWHALYSCYSDRQRHYHNLGHIAALLRLADAEREFVARPDMLEFAIWFHDAIYDTRAKDNERRSADWARLTLEAMGLDPVLTDQVEACILSTQTHELPPDPPPDLSLFLDLDLAIFAAPEMEYDAYSRRIREEYAWVSDADYRAGRASVLQRFADRPTLYFTPRLAECFEVQARRNITRELKALRAS